ncbi:hypothetical protein A2U01_0045154, partial [Trifolium medium]|nr:hypothetical protein [Trifolium medium]
CNNTGRDVWRNRNGSISNGMDYIGANEKSTRSKARARRTHHRGWLRPTSGGIRHRKTHISKMCHQRDIASSPADSPSPP